MYLYFDHTNKGIIDEFKNDNETFNEFGPLTNINILVGANNSRKSRLLRYILKQSEYATVSDKISHNIIEIESCINKLLELSNNKEILKYIVTNNISSYHNGLVKKTIEEFGKKSLLEKQIVLNKAFFDGLLKTIKIFSSVSNPRVDFKAFKEGIDVYILKLKVLVNMKSLSPSIANGNAFNFELFLENNSSVLLHLIGITSKIILNLEHIYETEIKRIVKKNRIYIPTLRRGISIFQNGEKLEGNIYQDTIEQLYGVGFIKRLNLLEMTKERLEIDLALLNSLFQILFSMDGKLILLPKIQMIKRNNIFNCILVMIASNFFMILVMEFKMY